MAEKTTRKDLFERIATEMAHDAEVVEMCEKYITSLSKPRKKTENKEAKEFRAAVATWLSEHEGAYTLAEIAADMDVTWQKVNSACRTLADEGVAIRVEPENKKDKVAYMIVKSE